MCTCAASGMDSFSNKSDNRNKLDKKYILCLFLFLFSYSVSLVNILYFSYDYILCFLSEV